MQTLMSTPMDVPWIGPTHPIIPTDDEMLLEGERDDAELLSLRGRFTQELEPLLKTSILAVTVQRN